MTVLAKSIKRFFHSSKRSESVFRAIAIAVILAMFLQLAMPVAKVSAEGSKETVANGGKRALTEWRTNTTAGFYRRTFFRVFANAGEYILMGSSAVGVNNGDIVLYRESQIANSQIAPATLSSITPTFTCSAYRTTHNGAGVLNTRAKELAGPASNAGGYTPCVYQATETGTYWVAMYGPDGASSAADGTAGTIDAPVVDNNQRSGVSMWDITVRSGNALTGTMKPGRVFVDYLAQISGSNGAAYQMYSTLYAATADGYVYQVDLNGLDPNGYIFYGNRVGFYDPDGKTPLYHDAVYPDNSLSVDAAYGGVLLASATAKIFFNNPLTSDLPVSILPTPVVPSINNVTFSGTASNNTSYYSQGGTFTYSGNVGGITEVIIQGNTSTDFEPDNPLNRRLLSESIVGSNSLSWDGKDNNGNYFPVRTDYPYKVIFHAGEYHFPLLDSENSVLGGPVLTLLNPFSGVCPFFSNCHGAFYDDRVYKVSTGAIVPSASYTVGSTLPGDSNSINPPATNHSDQSDGYDTSTAQRAYGSGGGTGFGNWKALDLWSYYPVDAISKTLNIVATTAQDLNITKTHSGNFSVGNNGGSFSIVVKNVGTTSIGNVDTQVTDTLPTGMTLYATPTGTNWSCSGAAGESSFTCTRASGSSHRNLAAGASFEPITVRVNVASSIAASVTNTATLTNTNDGNSANNSSSDTVNIARAELTISKTDSTAKKGLVNTPFNWEITALNTGELSAAFASGRVIFSDPLSANATYGTPLVTTSNVTNPGAINCTVAANTLTCTASGSTVTMLEADSRISVVLPTTPTAAGSFVNTATIDPNNVVVESNEANNTGSDTVTVYSPKLSVAKSSTATVVTSVDQIIPYTFTVTNPGDMPLHNVVVSDAKCDATPTLSSGDSNSDSILDPTETWLYVCNHTVTQTEFDAGAALSNTVTADSDETDPVTDILALPVVRINVTKEASPAIVEETGEDVTYTFSITNESTVPVTISSLTDDRLGTLTGDSDCKVGTSLAVGASCSFTYTTNISGAAGTVHENTFTAAAQDSIGNTAIASDDATVTFSAVTPTTYSIGDLVWFDTNGDGVKDPAEAGIPNVRVYIDNNGNNSYDAGEPNDSTDTNGVYFITGLAAGIYSVRVDTTTLPSGYIPSYDKTMPLDNEATVTLPSDLPTAPFAVLSECVAGAAPGCPNPYPYPPTNTHTAIQGRDNAFNIFIGGNFDILNGGSEAEGKIFVNGDLSVQKNSGSSYSLGFVGAGSYVVPDNGTDFVIVGGDVTSASGVHTGFGGSINTSLTDVPGNLHYKGNLSGDVAADDIPAGISGDSGIQGQLISDTALDLSSYQTMLDQLAGSSVCWADQPATTAKGTFTDNGSSVTFEGDGTSGLYVYNLDQNINPGYASEIYFKNIPETATVLINVIKTGDVTINAGNFYFVDGAGTALSDNAADRLAERVMWNFPNATNVYLTGANQFRGSVLSSAATTYVDTSTNGRFVALGDVKQGSINLYGSFEFHNYPFNGSLPSCYTEADFGYTNQVLPEITVNKEANPTSVAETGEDVTYTFTVSNSGDTAVTITALNDDKFGTLTGDDDCKIGTVLAASASCQFTYTTNLSGVAGTSHENTFTATAEDTHGNSAEDSAEATVTFTDVLPSISVTKVADPTHVDETGGDITFTFTVSNDGTVPVTITSLEDDVYGTLSGDVDCQVGTSLAPSTSCSFEVTKTLSGSVSTPHQNTFTAEAEDTENNKTSDSADATVTFDDVLPSIRATKAAAPTSVPETGGDVTFTFTVSNDGTVPVAITSLEDNVYGTLTGDSDCQIGTTLTAGGSCSFEVTKTVSGAVGSSHNDIFTVKAEDTEGNEASDTDTATVTFNDVLPSIAVTKVADLTHVDETGANVTFTFTVSNDGTVPVTITSLSDSIFGTLSGDADCQVGTSLAVGANCAFEETHTLSGSVGTPHVNTFTAEAEDSEGNVARDDADATVSFDDVLPSITVTKTADPLSVPETGGEVTFTFTVSNDGTVPVTVTSLEDDVYGTLSGDADCQVGTSLAAGGSCTFELTKTLSGSVSTPHSDTFSAKAEDADGNETSDSDDASVSFSDVLPSISVSKTADPLSVPETGGDVTFTFTVTNSGTVPVSITSLEDDVYGTLSGDADCQIGTTLAAGANCTFEVTKTLSGAVDTPHQDTFTAEAEDADGNSVGDSADASVTFEDVLPSISVTKSADPIHVGETGGDVTFTFTVENDGTVPVSITSLSDNVFGTLTGDSDCQVGTSLPAGTNCSFEETHTLNGSVGISHQNTFTVEAEDTEGNSTSDSADATVTFDDVLPSISVSKSASPTSVPETGGEVTFTFEVENDGPVPVTIASLSDDVFGTLSGDADCAVGTTLAVSASCQFTYTTTLNGAITSTHKNTFTAAANDAENNTTDASDDATVTFTDVLPSITVSKSADPTHVDETGGDVTFTFTVTNDGTVPVTITSLEDDVYGTLSGDADCQVGTTLVAGANCAFEMTQTVSGSVDTSHQNTFTAEAEDSDGNSTQDSADATVTYDDVLPSISVTKSADPTSVDETGGDVTFTYTVTNDGTVSATITSLEDDVFGTLSGDADCQIGTELAAGTSCSFEVVKHLSGAVGVDHENTFTAEAEDSEGNVANDADDATVTFADVLPSISVTKSADPTSVDETGGDVTFTFTVENDGTVPVSITSLSDNVFGTLAGDSDCQVGTTLAVGASCSFEQTHSLSGSVSTPHQDTFTAEAEDTESNVASDDADATVTFNDVLPSISVSKSADPSSVDETGGDVTFTFTVNNTGTVPVTITSLEDDVYGTLSGDADCLVGTSLAVGGSCSFEVTKTLNGSVDTPHQDTFTATGEDEDGNSTEDSADATVTFNDVKPSINVTKDADPSSVDETGGDVTFTFTVNNDGLVPVTITSLSDSVYGALSGDADCQVGTTLAAGASCSFEVTKTLSGAAGTSHENTFTAQAEDTEGNDASDSDNATVTFNDVLPSISVSKSADPTSVDETGGNVTFTFTVNNTGTVPVTITSLEDDVFGTLDGDSDCQVGTELAASGSCSFELTRSLSGSAGTTHENTFTAAAVDAEENNCEDSDEAVVTFVDVLPSITVSKSADPTSMIYTGGDVTFTFTVNNNGTVPVTITSLEDDKFGTLTGDSDCQVGTELAAGASCSFEYSTHLSGDPETTHTNTFTAAVEDIDGNPTDASDTADVDFVGTAILGLAKELVSKTPVNSDNFDLTYQFVVKNYGTKDLTNIQIAEDLEAAFPAPTLFTVTSVLSSDLSVNADFDGSAHKDLLAGTDTLLSGESATITLVVNVTPAKAGPFNNMATVSGETSTGSEVSDDSQNGSDPDGPEEEHDGNPTNNNDPTPVTFDGTLYAPPVGIKSVDATAKPILTWSMVWVNNANKVPLLSVVHDPIPAKTTFVADPSLTGVGMPADAPTGSTMDGVSCSAGTSTSTVTTMCYYEGPTTENPRGQVIWAGVLGPDFGSTIPDTAENAIHIAFAVTVDNGTSYVKNVATIDADLNGDEDTADAGETKVANAVESWGTPPSTSNANAATEALVIPETGFAPGANTLLPTQPLAEQYAELDSIWLEIPSLKLNTPIVGVPQKNGEWNITWLGNQAGWLNGTAFPTWAGNSVITGHVYDANGQPGVFANLAKLKFGDLIVIHAFGQQYVYEVRETKEVSPTDVAAVTRHEELPWITLVTCRGYDAATNSYESRYLVRAVQVKIK